jgi:hypothetical protein
MGRNLFGALALVALLTAARPGTGVPTDNSTFAANPAKAPVLPPLPPAPKSPIDYFRQLLGASAAERERLLTNRTPAHRRVLESSLRIYDKLPADEREVRLRTMELRFYFNAVLTGFSSNRAERLQAVPEPYRRGVETRLSYWDGLTADVQQQVQAYERLTRLLASRGGVGSDANLPPFPEPRGGQIQKAFRQIFELTPAERAAIEREVAGKLSAAEREQIEQTLDKFRLLSREQREQAVRGFQKFAELSVEERRQFLRNAQTWEKMAPTDRQKWREIVAKLPPMPPMPPGYGLPPLPPLPRPLPPVILVDTNR